MLASRGVVVAAILATATSARAAGGDDVRPGYVGKAVDYNVGFGFAVVTLGATFGPVLRF